MLNNTVTKKILIDILYVPKLQKNLFLIGKAISQNLKFNFQQNKAIFFSKSKLILTATKKNSFYYINEIITILQVNLSITNNKNI